MPPGDDTAKLIEGVTQTYFDSTLTQQLVTVEGGG